MTTEKRKALRKQGFSLLENQYMYINSPFYFQQLSNAFQWNSVMSFMLVFENCMLVCR